MALVGFVRRAVLASFLAVVAIVGFWLAYDRFTMRPITSGDYFGAALTLMFAGVVAFGASVTAVGVHGEWSALWRVLHGFALTFSVIAVAFAFLIVAWPPLAPSASPTGAWSSVCSAPMPTPWGSSRLTVISDCEAAWGTASAVSVSFPDGDKDVCLKPDASSMSLIDAANVQKYDGCLMVEVPFVQWAGHLTPVPGVGQHVRVVGRLVRDENYGWNEIHPAVAVSLE